ncbi:hypothetical protein [Streptomyces hokutonensis]|uniref:hypothetical protein n=1 Tax=Streptomyces hokutonensis TaxID=1306990 RepID=UPI0037FF47AA
MNVLRTSNRLWAYFSPAEDIAPGERTGRFRIGSDQLVLDAGGRSRISAEDAAVALVDEAELPRFIQRRFTVGYSLSLFHPVLAGDMGWSVAVVTRQGPSSLAW